MTSRGFKEKEFEQIGRWIVEVLSNGTDEYAHQVKKMVQELTAQFPVEAVL